MLYLRRLGKVHLFLCSDLPDPDGPVAAGGPDELLEWVQGHGEDGSGVSGQQLVRVLDGVGHLDGHVGAARGEQQSALQAVQAGDVRGEPAQQQLHVFSIVLQSVSLQLHCIKCLKKKRKITDNE